MIQPRLTHSPRGRARACAPKCSFWLSFSIEVPARRCGPLRRRIDQNSNARKRRVVVLRVTPGGQLKLRTIEKKEFGIVHGRMFAVKVKKPVLLFFTLHEHQYIFYPVRKPYHLGWGW